PQHARLEQLDRRARDRRPERPVGRRVHAVADLALALVDEVPLAGEALELREARILLPAADGEDDGGGGEGDGETREQEAGRHGTRTLARRSPRARAANRRRGRPSGRHTFPADGQRRASTHVSQAGRRAVQTLRPCQMIAWPKKIHSSRGTSSTRSCSTFGAVVSPVSPSRAESRRTWVSTTTPEGMSKAVPRTTFAVLRATPGT